MSYGSGSHMRGKTALILLLVVFLGCHAFSAHCGRQLDGGGDGQTGRGTIKTIRPLPGKCAKSRCFADTDSLDGITSCFCCLSMPENPCFRNEAECVKVCRPQALPPWSPPPPSSSGGGSD